MKNYFQALLPDQELQPVLSWVSELPWIRDVLAHCMWPFFNRKL